MKIKNIWNHHLVVYFYVKHHCLSWPHEHDFFHTNPSVSASISTGFLVVVAFMTGPSVPRPVATSAGSGASRATGTLGMDVPVVPPRFHRWNFQSDKKLGELARNPDKNTQTNTNSSNKIWTMSKLSVENIRETHLQRNLPIWHAFKLRCKNLPDSTVFLNVQRKRETWHSWTIVKLSWITFFCSKKIRQGNVEYPTNQWRNTK